MWMAEWMGGWMMDRWIGCVVDGWRVTEGCMMGEWVDEWTTGWLAG